jgi:hypothetical protein
LLQLNKINPLLLTPCNPFNKYQSTFNNNKRYVKSNQQIYIRPTIHNFPPLNYQPKNPQQLYNSHFPPLFLQQNATQAAITSQIESDDDLELEESSDKETQESVHEWQSVDKTKKRKRKLSQKNYDKTKQTYMKTSNRFEALSQQNGNSSNEQTQPNTHSHLNHLLFLYTVFEITRR